MAEFVDFTKELLEAIATPAEQPKTNGKTSRKAPTRGQKKTWTIEEQDAFLDKHNIEAKEREPYKDGSTKRQLAECPFCQNTNHIGCAAC